MKILTVILSFIGIAGLITIITLVVNRSADDSDKGVKNKPELVKKEGAPSSSVKENKSFHVTMKGKKSDPPSPVEYQVSDTEPPPIENPHKFVQVKLYSPDSSVKFAMGDILTIPEEERQYIRYFSLYNIPKAKRKDYAAIISFLVNSLSTRRRIYIPEFVGASDETVIRIDIRDYEWEHDSWEKLAKEGSGPRALPEPYFHTVKEEPVQEKRKVKKKVKKMVWRTKKVPKKTWDSYYQKYRTTYEEKRVQEEVEEEIEVTETVFGAKRKRTLLIAPWLEQEAISQLVQETTSISPIVRADWFIVNASVAPAYYNFLKLGNTLDDFEKLVFANEELAKKAHARDKAAVVSSIVARNNRMLIRSPTFTNGYYWKSIDTLTSVNDRQYVQNPLTEDFDATEDIGTLPNGLQAYFIADGKGERVDFADPNIAIDHTSADRLVRAAKSCMICHSDGIRPINDEIRELTKNLADQNQVKLLIARENDYYKIDALFGGNLDEQIIKDQNLYRAAVAKANGLTSERTSELLARIYANYYEKLLTKEDVSREVAVPLNELDEYFKLSNDSIILGMLKTPIRALRRDQWEFNYYRFMTLIMAHKQKLKQIDEVPAGPLIPLEELEKTQKD